MPDITNACKVCMSIADKAKISNLGLRFTEKETGGYLFGTWHDSNTAVVRLVVGPGKQARGDKGSFSHDRAYQHYVHGIAVGKLRLNSVIPPIFGPYRLMRIYTHTHIYIYIYL